MRYKKIIFYIDQQSYGNLSVYDHSLLSKVDNRLTIHYFCNKLYDAQDFNNNIHQHKIFRYSNKEGLAKKISYTISICQLLFFALYFSPSAIHQQWIKAPFLDLFIWQFCKLFFNTKIIYTAHNVLPHTRTMKSHKEYQSVYSLCETIISHTVTSKTELIHEFPNTAGKIEIIPHGVLDFNIKIEDICSAKKIFREKYGLSKDKIVLGMFGYQSLYKGTDLILNAWTTSPELYNDNNIRLIIIGKSEQNIIPKSLPDNIIVVDRYLENAEFEAFLELSDVILMPYRRIDQSGLLLTIINKNIPFCVSNVGELTKPLDIADVGWQFNSLEINDIKQKIKEIASHPAQIQTKRNNPQWKDVKSYYDWTKSAAFTENLYKLYIQ